MTRATLNRRRPDNNNINDSNIENNNNEQHQPGDGQTISKNDAATSKPAPPAPVQVNY